MMINWDEIRKQFPVTETSTYLNAAAAGPLSRATSNAASTYYRQMMEDGDTHWDEWLDKREEARKKVAAFINAEPDEIAFTTNTSSGMNVIVDALEQRGEVISCDLEFPVSTLPWMHRDIAVHLVKSVEGVLRLEDIERAMTAHTGVICLSHVQFSNGFRSDLEELGNAKRDQVLVVNAAQSAGAFKIDVKEMKIDALCATGHKWMLSGYGSGFVYVSRELLEQSRPRAIGWLSVKEPYAVQNTKVDLRTDAAARAELGCPHFAGIFAMSASTEMVAGLGATNTEGRVLSLNRHLTDRLIESGRKVLSPIADEKWRSAETLVEVEEPARTVSELAARGVIVTEKPQGIRVSTHLFNNEGDIERLMEALDRTG
ncbi:MAG TPA: aminotransferase class V-fold PLP-dependent enzyme [Pyrinomonadaceae bacterium]|nr:aminotransferase class V-fold PLP-dependent enzyme [Pyrinomonadaceae bacterium]